MKLHRNDMAWRLLAAWVLLSFTIPATSKVAAANILRLDLAAVSSQGALVESVAVGERFDLRVFVHDLREPDLGAFSVFTDIVFDAERVSLTGAVIYNASFPLGHTDFDIRLGHLDEFGGIAGLTSPSEDTLLLTIPFEALSAGNANFTLTPASLVHHQVTVFGKDEPLRSSDIEYGALRVTVVPEPATFNSALFATSLAIIFSSRRRG